MEQTSGWTFVFFVNRRQLAVLGRDTMSAVGRWLAPSCGPMADVTVLSLCCISMSVLLGLEELEEKSSSRGGMGSMHWAGMLAWPAAVLSAAPELLLLFGSDTRGQLLEPVSGMIAAYMKVSSRLGGDAEAKRSHTCRPPFASCSTPQAGWPCLVSGPLALRSAG